MENKRYKPMIDKYFWIIWVPLMFFLLAATLLSLFEPIALVILLLTDLFCFYFMVSSLVGYVELREKSVYIKFGFIIKRDIPYNKIRKINAERKVLTYSFLSLKNALEHINIKYNKFDVVTVSVLKNDELIMELNNRIAISKGEKCYEIIG